MRNSFNQHPSIVFGVSALGLVATLSGCSPELPESNSDRAACAVATIETNALNATKEGLELLKQEIDIKKAEGELPEIYTLDNENALDVSWQANKMLKENTSGPSDPYVYPGESFELCIGQDGKINALRVLKNTSQFN